MPEEQANPSENMQHQSTAAQSGGDESALKEELEQTRAKRDEYLDSWRRAAADLSNYRKRAERDVSELTRSANSVLILRLLPVIDDFDRAFQTVPDELRDLTWVDGMQLIARKLRATLEAEGLKPIEAVGKPFDPNFHEAVLHEETDKYDEGLVMTELQKGYQLNERVLRPTLVKVSKRKIQAHNPEVQSGT